MTMTMTLDNNDNDNDNGNDIGKTTMSNSETTLFILSLSFFIVIFMTIKTIKQQGQ